MHPRRKRYGELGQGLVEFAVIFPLFVFFLFAILDVGIALDRRATLQHAAREGARYAATSADLGGAGDPTMTRTIDQAQGLVDPEDVCFTYANIDGGDIDAGDAVDVEIEYFYQPFILDVALGWFGAGIGDPGIDMTVKGSARLERELDPGAGDLCP